MSIDPGMGFHIIVHFLEGLRELLQLLVCFFVFLFLLLLDSLDGFL